MCRPQVTASNTGKVMTRCLLHYVTQGCYVTAHKETSIIIIIIIIFFNNKLTIATNYKT